ncbi:unnamed protein product [Symbiodinium sp. CCMP2592]|nr:unnamed protein product [Symbiodinium sp. CCMP2592]
MKYESVADRFTSDDQFRGRMVQEGRNMEDTQKFDYMSYAILSDPGRSEEQRHLRAGSCYQSEDSAGIGPAKLVFYANCDVEPMRTLRPLDDTTDFPMGVTYMGAFLSPRLFCEIAAVNKNAKRILTFDGEVYLSSETVNDRSGRFVL